MHWPSYKHTCIRILFGCHAAVCKHAVHINTYLIRPAEVDGVTRPRHAADHTLIDVLRVISFDVIMKHAVRAIICSAVKHVNETDEQSQPKSYYHNVCVHVQTHTHSLGRTCSASCA